MVEISRLFWKKVFTSDAFMLGETESADLDENTWKIKSFFVSLSDEAVKMIGFKRPYLGKVMVCLPVDLIKAVKDTVLLNKSIMELSDLKQCKE